MDSVLELVDARLVKGGAPLLDGVDFATRAGQHWAVLGPNGAGKTSLVRAACGRTALRSGRALLDGEDLLGIDPAELATRIALVSKSSAPSIRGGQRVRDLVRTSAWGIAVRRGEDYEEADEARCEDLLAVFGISGLAEREFRTLSEGEAQRVLLARSLMSDPEVLILDEPSAGLDLGGRELLVSALEEIIGGERAPQVVLVTHQLEEIPAGITHAALMSQGGILAQGPIEETLTGANLSTAYGLQLSAGRDNGRWWARGLARA